MTMFEKLSQLRKEHGLSQADVAEQLNVSRQAISRWETGDAIPTTENLILLSKLYQVSLGYLVGEEERTPPNVSPENKAEVSPSSKNHRYKNIMFLILTLLLCGTLVGLFLHTQKEQKDEHLSLSNMTGEVLETSPDSDFGFVEW